MINSTENENKYDKPARATFLDDEKAHPWLSLLLDGYLIFDEGVTKAVALEEKKGRNLACKKGCSACCRAHTTIPVYPLELVGMTWYATEKVQNPLRKKLAKQLKNYKDSETCPFLVDGTCSIHPLRPAACRQFNVFDKVCEEGEDAFHTRREDVMTPIQKYADKAFNAMLPFYGAKNRSQRRQVLKSGIIHTRARPMLSCNWSTLPDKMKEYEKEHPELFGKSLSSDVFHIK
jgi:Fe-S-cluster containining protein